MTDEAFSKLVAEGIDELREDIRRRMHNIAIVIADNPTEEQCEEHGLEHEGELFGLYEGVPLIERGVDAPFYPDKITIFKEPILKAYSRPEDIRECVINTVWHEVAHHFGLTEDEVREEELKRGKTI